MTDDADVVDDLLLMWMRRIRDGATWGPRGALAPASSKKKIINRYVGPKKIKLAPLLT